MLYYDATESRANTRLHPSILDLGEPVVGLEPATGADLLISPRGAGLASNVNRLPGKVQLPLYLEHGWLIQRKSGNDLLNSIQDLRRIILRMRSAGDSKHAKCWLLICGQYECSRDGKVIVDGWTSGWQWTALQGALEVWQLLGGHISLHPSDEAAAIVLERWTRNIQKMAQIQQENTELAPAPPPTITFDPNPWRTVLMGFPHIGDVLSNKIAEHCGNLVESLLWMTQQDGHGVPGVGEKMRRDWREFLGLGESQHLMIIDEEPPTIHPERELADEFNGRQ